MISNLRFSDMVIKQIIRFTFMLHVVTDINFQVMKEGFAIVFLMLKDLSRIFWTFIVVTIKPVITKSTDVLFIYNAFYRSSDIQSREILHVLYSLIIVNGIFVIISWVTHYVTLILCNVLFNISSFLRRLYSGNQNVFDLE